MISEENERTTFKIGPEVENSGISYLEFTVKGGISLLSRRKLG